MELVQNATPGGGARSSVEYVDRLNDTVSTTAFIPNSPSAFSASCNGSELSNYLVPTNFNVSMPNTGRAARLKRVVINMAPSVYLNKTGGAISL